MSAASACRAIVTVMMGVVTAMIVMSCGATAPMLTAPSTPLRSELSPNDAPASFGQLGALVPDLATCLRAPSAGCFSVVASPQRRIGARALGAPTNLTSTVMGTTVTLTWTATAGAVSYLIEAGSSSGSANLASLPTGNALTTFSTTGVPAGTYFVRVRAIDASGAAGLPSNEVVVVVGGGCVLPGAPTGLSITQNSGGTVGLSWTAASGAPTSYILEAGSAPGLANLANVDVGAATSLTATGVVPGTYFVRVRARNACGVGAASIEVKVVVTSTISISSLTVTCNPSSISFRLDTARCTATARFSDGSSAIATSGVTWQTSDSANGPVDANGVVTSNAIGPITVVITATFQGVSASFQLLLRGCGLIVPSCP